MQSFPGRRSVRGDTRCTFAKRTTSHVIRNGVQTLANVDGFGQFFNLNDLARRPVEQFFKQITPIRITERDDGRIVTAKHATDTSRFFRDDFWHVEDGSILAFESDEADGFLRKIQRQSRRVHIDDDTFRRVLKMVFESADLVVGFDDNLRFDTVVVKSFIFFALLRLSDRVNSARREVFTSCDVG